jgi:hypothetical protein
MEAILDQNHISETLITRYDDAFGKKVGLLAKVFGCWHKKELSRPFTENRKAYRVCLECGARRAFDPVTLKTFGPFYFPPAISHGKKAER